MRMTPAEIAEIIYQYALSQGDVKPTERASMIADMESSPELAGTFQAIEAAAYERAAQVAETPVSGEQDDITMAAKDRVASAIRALAKED